MTCKSDFPAKSLAWSSRMRRTSSTALIVFVSAMGGYLSRREYGQGLVPLLDIHGVEEPDLVHANDVSEVPSDQNIHFSSSRQGDVQHVVLKSAAEDGTRPVPGKQLHGLPANIQNLGIKSD